VTALSRRSLLCSTASFALVAGIPMPARKFATGGLIPPGTLGLIGERGPEPFRISPVAYANMQVQRALLRDGSLTVTLSELRELDRRVKVTQHRFAEVRPGDVSWWS